MSLITVDCHRGRAEQCTHEAWVREREREKVAFLWVSNGNSGGRGDREQGKKEEKVIV